MVVEARGARICGDARLWISGWSLAPDANLIDPRIDRTLHRSARQLEAMMQKLENETGIYRLEDDRYRVVATAKNPKTGEMGKAQKTLKVEATLEDARAVRESLKVELRKPPEVKKRQRLNTVADFAEFWIERKSRNWKPSTEKKAVNALSYHVLPEIGEIPIGGLSRRDISEWIFGVEEKRKPNGDLYSTASVRGWWRVLRTMIRDAHAQGFISEDVTSRHDTPNTGVSDRQEKRTLSGPQLGRLVKAARDVQPLRFAEIATLAFTGMRVGEMYGLHWDDVDLGDQIIHIRRAAWKGEVDTPKTEKARRTVYVHDFVADVLRDHREEMMREQKPGFEEGIVFPSTKGTYRYGTSLAKPLRLVSEYCGFDFAATPQVLRRTWNTLLLEARVDRITIRSMMGHTSEQMTERYAGIPDRQKRKAVNGVLGDVIASELATSGRSRKSELRSDNPENLANAHDD